LRWAQRDVESIEMSGRVFDELAAEVLREIGDALGAVKESDARALCDAIQSAPCIFIAGKGRSGLQAQAFAMRLMHLGLPVHVVDEATTPGIRAGNLLVIASGSGRTPALVQNSQKAKNLGARIALVTSVPDSPIARDADLVVCLRAPTPKAEHANASASIQPMGSLFEQALGIFLDIVVLELMEARQMTAEQMFERHANLE
jgi:6-phospho-3-hexuloisomerase